MHCRTISRLTYKYIVHAAGLGKQPLYSLSVILVPPSGQSLSTSRRIGFRSFALVTGNDTDPTYVQRALGQDGTDTQGMLFRVNGALIFSRGANMIPMEELEVRFEHVRMCEVSSTLTSVDCHIHALSLDTGPSKRASARYSSAQCRRWWHEHPSRMGW